MKSSHSFKKIILGILIFTAGFFTALYLIEKIEYRLEFKKIEAEKVSILEEAKKNMIEYDGEIDFKASMEKNIITETAYLEVPFICQAPLETVENWKYHEESCEEAALLQAYLYETDTKISKPEAHEKILEMIEWQKKNMGGHRDLYAKDMKKFATGFYGLKENEVKIIKDATIEDIKNEITNGHPVIVPITGDILNNPYYPYPGYHMLVVIGYTKEKIITNDNGTKRGKDFSYDIKTFGAAMKDSGGDVLILEIRY